MDAPRPHNIDAERELLSALLTRADAVSELDGLAPTDFYNTQHRNIFAAVLRHGPDIALITHELGEGYGKTLSGILDMPSPFSVPVMAKAIRDMRVRRDLLDQANAIAKRAQSNDPIEDTLAYAYQAVQRLMPDIGQDERAVSMAHVYTAERMVAEYESYLKNLRNNRFVTGIQQIDERIRGVGGGEVLTVLARAGSFKTALLQNMLHGYCARSSWGALLFSLEMPVASITERYFQILDGCDGREVERTMSGGHPPDVVEASVNQFKRELKNLFVVPTKVGLQQMKEYVRLVESQTGVKIGVIGIDYLGLIDAEGDSEYAQVSAVARGCKGLAKALNIPVLLLSQVNRQGGDGEVEIALNMGRGSGAIEEGADFVIGLWQQENKSSSCPEDRGEYDLIARILKNRKGPRGSRWRLELYPHSMQFGPNATEHNPPPKTKRRGRCEA